MNTDQLHRFINNLWDAEIIPRLTDYIRIPNRSPAFDPQWQEHGHMAKAVELLSSWARQKLAPAIGSDRRRGPAASGWDAPALAPWLQVAAENAGQTAFGQPPTWMGEGGSIPFMGMLGEKFPQAQFLVTGVLGPHSNAHGPDEFLHIPTGKRVTTAVACVLAEHAQRR